MTRNRLFFAMAVLLQMGGLADARSFGNRRQHPIHSAHRIPGCVGILVRMADAADHVPQK